MWVGNTATDYYARPTAAGGGAIAAVSAITAAGADNVAIGVHSKCIYDLLNSVAIGYGPTTGNSRSVAIGWSRILLHEWLLQLIRLLAHLATGN